MSFTGDKISSTFAPSFRNEWRCAILERYLNRITNAKVLRGLGTHECIHRQALLKIFKTMENQINLEVIDQMFAAQMSANESQERIEALRPQVMEAVEELIRQRGLPKKFTGIIEYHGFKIRVQRPKSYTWELNTQLKDENLDYYKKQHAMYEQLQADVKDLRRDMKRTGEKLEKAYPDSESIKYGLTIAVMK